MKAILTFCAAGLLAAPAAAQSPSVVNTWFVDPIGAAFVGGLDYDPGTDTIWIADETNVLISQYDRAGVMLFQGPPAAASTLPIGVGVDPANGHVWIGDENEMVYEYDNMGVPTGFSFSALAAIADLSGLAFNPTTGNIWISQDSGVRTLAEFDQMGALLNSIDLTPTGSIDPDGLAFNPVTDTAYLGDDTQDLIYEIDLQGNVIQTWDMSALGISPEGLGVDTANGMMFIGDGFITRSVYEVDNIVAPAPTGPTLTRVGQCGMAGSGLQATNMTANSPVGFAASPNATGATVPGGPCGPVMVDLAPPFFVIGVILADGTGTATLLPGPGIPAVACGWTAQALDFGTCTTTNSTVL